MSHDAYKRAVMLLYPPAMITVILGLIVALWAATPSSGYLHPALYTFDPATREVTFVREITDPPLVARWRHEIVTESGLECSASGEAFYQHIESNTARFPVPESLLPCLTGESRASRLEWQVLWAGVVPLRPVLLTQTFTGGN